MGASLYLIDPVSKEVLEAEMPHQIKGSTYAVGGTTELTLAITYNYSPIIGRVLPDGLRGLCGKTGAETIPLLKAAVEQLGTDVDDDYWKPTEGNARRALCGLLAFAQMRPDGVWEGSF